jgi:hypothetical protein
MLGLLARWSWKAASRSGDAKAKMEAVRKAVHEVEEEVWEWGKRVEGMGVSGGLCDVAATPLLLLLPGGTAQVLSGHSQVPSQICKRHVFFFFFFFFLVVLKVGKAGKAARKGRRVESGFEEKGGDYWIWCLDGVTAGSCQVLKCVGFWAGSCRVLKCVGFWAGSCRVLK